MRHRPFSILAGLALALVFAPPTFAQQQPASFDILIRGGMVLDGAGNPAVRADVGIVGDTIVAVGRLEGAAAARTIDATGLHVTPGFIDMHSHADGAFAGRNVEARRAPNLVTQGITTVVFGADGRNTRWPTADEMAAFADPGVALNVIPMVGHGTVRGRVLGRDTRRASTPEEIERMKALVRQGMEEGAWGIGAGPEYSPGNFSTTEEIVELAKVIAPYDGFYYAHQRSQSRLPRGVLPSEVTGPLPDGIDGLKETIRIAEEAGIRAVGSHIKAKGVSSWGRAYMDTMLVDRARERGAQVYFDHYPYETFDGGASAMFPGWALRGGAEGLQGVLADPAEHAKLQMDLDHVVDIYGGADRLIITSHVDASLVGKSVGQVARERGKTPNETLIDFALAGNERLRAGHLARNMGMSEYDNDQYIRQDYTATSTDGGVTTQVGGPPGRHPRYWGAFPRKISRYVKERGVITLPFAIRSMTSLGAQIIGLPDRGEIREGYKADITIFSFPEITDRATIMEPGLPSEGIYYVTVNGKLLMDNKQLTGELAGRVLNRNEVKKSVRISR